MFDVFDCVATGILNLIGSIPRLSIAEQDLGSELLHFQPLFKTIVGLISLSHKSGVCGSRWVYGLYHMRCRSKDALYMLRGVSAPGRRGFGNHYSNSSSLDLLDALLTVLSW